MLDLKNELNRCLGCKIKPCQKACPLGVSPHDFIAYAKAGDFKSAAAIIADVNPLPQTCGLVCPDKFCQKACIRAKIDTPIAIPCLQATIMQQGGYPDIEIAPKQNKKAAIIGGGPAGLGAVFEFLKSGWQIDLYEKNSYLGGAARLIPSYRLPRSVLDFEISRLTQNEHVNVFLNTHITDFSTLKDQYDAVILALGEITPRTLGINGEQYCIPYTQYLSHPERYCGQKVAVTGGGEVALDCAITAKKNGSECVEMFVRRRREDMRIMPKDQQELNQCGIIVHDLSSITAITPNQSQALTLCAIKNQINDQGKAVACIGTDYSLEGYDVLIQALGSYYPKEDIPQGFITAGDMNADCGMVVQALASGINAVKKAIQD